MYVENSSDPLVQTWIIPGLYLGYPGIIGRKSSASSWRTLWKWCLLRTSSGSCRVLQTCWMLSAFLLSVSLYWKPGRFFDKLPFLYHWDPLRTVWFASVSRADVRPVQDMLRMFDWLDVNQQAGWLWRTCFAWRFGERTVLLHRYQVTSSNLAKPNVLQSLCRAASTKKISWLASTACVELRGSKLRPPRPPVRSVRNADFHRIGHSCSEIVVLFWWLAIKIY